MIPGAGERAMQRRGSASIQEISAKLANNAIETRKETRQLFRAIRQIVGGVTAATMCGAIQAPKASNVLTPIVAIKSDITI
jgi:hypothetical protein